MYFISIGVLIFTLCMPLSSYVPIYLSIIYLPMHSSNSKELLDTSENNNKTEE